MLHFPFQAIEQGTSLTINKYIWSVGKEVLQLCP